MTLRRPLHCFKEKKKKKTQFCYSMVWGEKQRYENKIYFIAAECSMRKSDYFCCKLKFYFAGLLKVYCVWKEGAILLLKQERAISQQTHKKGVNVFAYFLGQHSLISDAWDREMPLSIHCIFSKTFPFVALFNLHFVVTKLRNSTLVVHPLYKSSLWNLKWPICLHITLFALFFLESTRDWWSGLADLEVNLAGDWGEDDQ